MSSVAEARSVGRSPRGRSIRGWLAARLLAALAAVLRRLPDRPLHRAAHLVGGLLHRVQPARRRLVRANLLRVCQYLVEHDLAGPRAAAAAIADPANRQVIEQDLATLP